MVRIVGAVLGVLFLVAGCTKKGGGDAALANAINSAPNYKAQCEVLRADSEKACGPGADCPLKDITATNNAMDVIAKSPFLQKIDVDLLNQFLSIKNPSRTDVAMGTGIIGRDCWSMLHVKVWRGLLAAVKSKATYVDKPRLQRLFRERVFQMDSNLPNYLKLSLKFVLVKQSVADGLFKMTKEGQKPLEDLENKLKAVRASLNQEYAKAFQGDRGQPTDPDPEKAKYDPELVANIMKRELAQAQSLSSEVNMWITKYLIE